MVTIASGSLTATIRTTGAQMVSLKRADGLELLWHGDSAFWPEHAPILFPLLGPLTNQQLRHQGRKYDMPAHGFAKSQPFEIVERSRERVALQIEDNPETRSMYPFSFQLQVLYELRDNTLHNAIVVTNKSGEVMPCDVGFHPGFQWPLHPDLDKETYQITFEQDEPAPIRRGIGDPIFLYGDPHPTPVQSNVLPLDEALFEDQAIVFDQINSRSLRYHADAGPELQIDFPDCPYLALWMRPGASYICVEPWQGLPVEHGWDGEYLSKPAAALIEPGTTQQWRMSITLTN